MKFKAGKQQGGLFDYQERKAALSRMTTPLDRLNERMDWELFREDLEGHLNYGDGSKGGRPPWCPVLMFKIIVLQKYYGLSEEQTEFQIFDRFSFQRFLDLEVGDDVPDKNAIWDFKGRLGKAGVRACFDLFDEVLRESGLLASRGKIVDASFVDVPRQRNSREENASIKEGGTPEENGAKGSGCALDDQEQGTSLRLQEPREVQRQNQTGRGLLGDRRQRA